MQAPDRTKLVKWFLLTLGGSNCEVNWYEDSKELVIRDLEFERAGEELEMDLFFKLLPFEDDLGRHPLERLRDEPGEESVYNLFAKILPPDEAKKVASALIGASYDKIVEEAHRRTRGMVDAGYNAMVRGREGLAAGYAAEWESWAIARDPKLASRAVFSEYARELGLLFPKCLKRAEGLRTLHTEAPVPEHVQTYVREATKCYVYGRFIACLLVCRAAVETALKDYLRREGKGPAVAALEAEHKEGLSALIALARSLRRPEFERTLDDADEIRDKANQAAHPHAGPPDAETCKHLFIKTRGVLKEVYA